MARQSKLYTVGGEKLVRPEHLLAYQVIIRAVHQRGEDQENCLAELDRRGLWLTEDQKIAAGLASRRSQRTGVSHVSQ